MLLTFVACFSLGNFKVAMTTFFWMDDNEVMHSYLTCSLTPGVLVSGSVPPASFWPSLHPSHIHYKTPFTAYFPIHSSP